MLAVLGLSAILLGQAATPPAEVVARCTGYAKDKDAEAYEGCLKLNAMSDDGKKALLRAAVSAMLGEAMAWVPNRVDIGDWIPMSGDKEQAKFIRRGREGQGWLRVEFREPKSFLDQRMASIVTLYGFDCKGRIRTLQATSYSEPNMKGESFSASKGDEWSYIIPGSTGDTMESQVCGPP